MKRLPYLLMLILMAGFVDAVTLDNLLAGYHFSNDYTDTEGNNDLSEISGDPVFIDDLNGIAAQAVGFSSSNSDRLNGTMAQRQVLSVQEELVSLSGSTVQTVTEVRDLADGEQEQQMILRSYQAEAQSLLLMMV